MPVYIKKKVPVRKCSLYQAGKLWEFIYLRNVQTTKNVKKIRKLRKFRKFRNFRKFRKYNSENLENSEIYIYI